MSINVEAENSTPNQRRLRRWSVSIPCSVSWEEKAMIATISNISFDGALIRAESTPLESSEVVVRFTFEDRAIHLQGSVTSEVIHAEEEGEEQTFGVKFDRSMEKYWTQLTPVIQALLKETDENEVAD
ncbi:MAG: PilZ domain-containing protein [Acidobacteria bacterium]|nr:PilZ domain-containing protein [Acidobacteriota bacterium]